MQWLPSTNKIESYMKCYLIINSDLSSFFLLLSVFLDFHVVFISISFFRIFYYRIIFLITIYRLDYRRSKWETLSTNTERYKPFKNTKTLQTTTAPSKVLTKVLLNGFSVFDNINFYFYPICSSIMCAFNKKPSINVSTLNGLLTT